MRWIIFILFFGVIELYAFQAVRAATKNPMYYWLYWLLTAIVIGNFIIRFYGISRNDFDHSHGYAFAFLIIFFALITRISVEHIPENVAITTFFKYGRNFPKSVSPSLNKVFVETTSPEDPLVIIIFVSD